MTKTKMTIATLALAGTMIFGGVGGLYVSISQARKEEAVVQVEQKDTKTSENVATSQKISEKQTWQKKEKIYLPEGAELKQKKDGNYAITWKDYDILFWRDSEVEQESKTDIGLAKLIPILRTTIKKYSGQDMDNGQIEVYMYKNVSEQGKNSVDNARYYGVKQYQVLVRGIPQHFYWIYVNSVTGEVMAYSDFDDSKGKEVKVNKEVLSEAEKKEYASIAEAFVCDELQMGRVKKTFGEMFGVLVGGKGCRTTCVLYCKTENGDIIEVTMDYETKTVQGFSLNPLYY